MSKNMKIVLIVLGCILLVCTGIAGIGFYWFSTAGKQMMEQVAQGSRKSIEEGKSFGQANEDNACLKESISRLQKDDSMSNLFSVTVFLQSCLSNSKRTAAFCEGVSGEGEMLKAHNGQYKNVKRWVQLRKVVRD